MELYLSLLDWTRFITGLGIFLFAARSDLGTRRVDDWTWWTFLAVGLAVLEAQLLLVGEGPLFLASGFYIAVFFVALWYEGDVLGEKVARWKGLAVAVPLVLVSLLMLALQVREGGLGDGTDRAFRRVQLLTMPLMMLVAYLLYRAQLLSGGADAKAFLALSVLVPFFPEPFFRLLEAPRVVELACPFVLAVFFNAAFFTLLNPVGMFLYNLGRGDRGLLMAFAYKLPIKEAGSKKFTWLSECIEDGRRKRLYFRFRGQTRSWRARQIRALERAGVKRVWVQPQIPFMVQLLGAFTFTFLFGNLILLGLIKTISGV